MVEESLDAFVSTNLRGVTYVADDCEYANVGLGAVVGPSAVRSDLQPFLSPFHENELIILRRAATGRQPLLWITATHTWSACSRLSAT